MKFAASVTIATHIEDNYNNYLDHLNEGGDREKYEGNLSGDWDSKGKVRVSKLAKDCPLRSTMESRGLVERSKWGLDKLALFEDARRAAEVVYESIAWSAGNVYTFEAEKRITDHWSGLVGTVDGVITINRKDMFPIEVKRTDSNKYAGTPRGISLDNMVQTIGEMIILGNDPDNYGAIPFGFIATRYSADSDPNFKVWTVLWDEDYQGWFLYYKGTEQSAVSKEWPTLTNGRIFISLTSYLEMYHRFLSYATSENIMEEPIPYEFLENWKCAKVKQPQNYAPNGKYKGMKKSGTGIVIPRCPLFEQCYGHELAQAGYRVPMKEYDLEKLESRSQ